MVKVLAPLYEVVDSKLDKCICAFSEIWMTFGYNNGRHFNYDWRKEKKSWNLKI
jgi:hypothetical protein